MRPTRLEIEGFASFRERQTIELADTSLFVLFGPTGAGKSSIIDAIVFALYGSVPRYDDRRLVAPAISQGLNEARVRLDFTVNGDAYTAVRVVQRTRTGATTREARLEKDGQALAANADELTHNVEALLGLSFDHFTRCVVLPQGEFAEFMHAKPADRQDLLVHLLGLRLYEQIRERANLLHKERDARASFLDERLEGELAAATPQAIEEAERRVAALEGLLEKINAAKPELEAMAKRRDEAQRAAAEASERAKLLRGVAVPEGVDRLVARVAGAADARAAATRALDEAVARREAAEQERQALPEMASLEAMARTLAELADATTREARAKQALEAAERDAADARRLFEDADAAAVAADERLRAIQRERAAAHLAEHLVPGEPCPVCLQIVDELPTHAQPPELAQAREAKTAADAERERARSVLDRHSATAAAREADVANARAQRERLTREAATLPSAERLAELRDRVAAADAALAAARDAESQARREDRRTATELDSVEADAKRAHRLFDELRDGLASAGLGPPAATRDDLRADWQSLVEWARERAPAETSQADEYRLAAETASSGLEWRMDELRTACSAADVDAESADPRDACADALFRAREALRRLRQDHEAAATLREELDTARKDAKVAKELGRHLDARNFERWLMTRALRHLVSRASDVLRGLSNNAYTLDLDERNEFLVVDHNSANERRMARTLSGGETFLASLALALALADQVAEMAAGGSARLEALFLDEGFGTLDADTLELVATAIEELGARGRMVGLVTHVRDLAERIPVRFDVRKLSNSSMVERVG